MESSPFSARRATPEDVPALQALWQQAGMPWEELGQFINEFQVATDTNGGLGGAAGLLIENEDALLHSEAILPDVDADAVRAVLWRRLQIVSRNQGVKRLWTQEDAPYWKASGFVPATAEHQEPAKASFLTPDAEWSVLPLANSARVQDAIQEQFAILEATRMQESETFQRRIKLFRSFAYLLAMIVMATCVVLLFVLQKSNPDFFRKLLGR